MICGYCHRPVSWEDEHPGEPGLLRTETGGVACGNSPTAYHVAQDPLVELVERLKADGNLD